MFSKNRGRPSKYISISNELSKYIRSGELADGSPMPSERKLAKLFDCTQVTLRKALKHLESEKMIYSVPYKGRFVGMKNSAMREKSNLAALIFPDDELFYYKIFSRLEPFFQENGQLLSVHITGNSETKERKLLEMFEAKNFDVVVAVPNPACRDIYAAGKTCIQIFQEAGKMIWYSHLFKNFPQFVLIHTVKGFGLSENNAQLWM